MTEDVARGWQTCAARKPSLLCWVCLASGTASLSSQQVSAPNAKHPRTRQSASLPAPQAAVAPPRQGTTSPPFQTLPSELQPNPATITLINGMLKVEANDSDLSQILSRISAVSGMVIDGSIQSARVFGEFGPQDPREVLNDLLVGSGYNYLMVGKTTLGTPRELRLSPKIGNASPPTPASLLAKPVEAELPGPGAILHVPPAPPLDPQERVRNNLKRLQQMHDSQGQPQ